MSELLFLQENFQDHLLQKKTTSPRFIVNTAKVKAKKRLSIYMDSYQWRLVEVLADTYPMLKKYLGEKKFNRIALGYVKQFDSSYRLLYQYGDQLSEFINNSFKNTSEFPYVELAQFEWALAEVFYAADQSIMNAESLSIIPPQDWASLKFSLHPSVRRLDLAGNIGQIWKALDENELLLKPQRNEYPVGWVFWRKELINQYCSLTVDEAWAIDAILKGATFGDVCEGLCEWIDERHVAERAVGFLKGWFTAGLITSVNIVT